MRKTPLLAFLTIAAVAAAQQPDHSIKMVYTDVDAGNVLLLLSRQTHQNILYNNKNKVSVTLNLAVDSVDSAIQAICSAAGVVYRKVGSLYVVAPKDGMKDALAPYAQTSTFVVDPGYADLVVTKLQDALPYTTVRAIGDKVSVTGIREDVQNADELIRETVRIQKSQRTITDIVVMRTMSAEDVAPLLKGLYPGLDVTATTSTKSAPLAKPEEGTLGPVVAASFGAIGLRGSAEVVAEAKETLQKLDTPQENIGPNRVVVRVYKLEYMNGPSLVAFLKKAAPEVQVIVGPEDMSPSRGQFNPLSQQIAATQSGSGGSAGGGTSTPTSGGGGGGAPSTGGATTPGGTTGVQTLKGDRAKSIVLKGREGDVDNALKLIADLDVKPRQVVIEVKVIETNPVDSAQLGVGYTFSPVNFFDVPPATLLTNAIGATTASAGSTQSLAPTNFSRSPLNFQATLNAMVSKQTAKLLATPSLQVIDNDQGSIFIGNTLSVEIQQPGALGATVEQIVQFPVGIILLVSPRISPDGSVTIHVNPVISAITSINAQGIPQTSAREAETTMILKDGETTVLGGLIQDQDTRTVTEVPWLSSLPLIGELFKTRTHNRTRDDILVSITPHIVKDTPPEAKK